MISRRLNSAPQAARDNRAEVIAIRAQTAAFKAQGGTVEQVGATRCKTIGVKRVHQMKMQSSKGKV